LLSGSGRYERRDEGLELLSIRQGMLFDQMGLRPGDTILSLNGQAPDGLDLLANTPDTDLLSGAFELEILRDGARQTVKVTLEQSS
jgi:S1-C subfamily serine protease